MPYCILAIICAMLGIGLLRLAWERRGERPLLTGASWLALCAAIPAWHGGGAAWDKAIALATLLPPLAALPLLAAQADWLSDRRIALRVRRPSRESGGGGDSRPAPRPDLEQLVQRARALVPGSRLGYVGIQRPGTRGARIVVGVGTPARLPRGEDIYFDARGRQIGRVGYLSGSTGLQVYSGAAQVHFGFFGGLPVRLAYVALGGTLSFITATGLAIWFERRERRGQPYPRLRRAWHAWTRGVPLALACAALLSRLLPVGWTFLVVVLAAQALALWRGPATTPVRSAAS